MIRRAEFAHDPVPFNIPEARRRRFDKMASFPDGYLIMVAENIGERPVKT